MAICTAILGSLRFHPFLKGIPNTQPRLGRRVVGPKALATVDVEHQGWSEFRFRLEQVTAIGYYAHAWMSRFLPNPLEHSCGFPFR